MYTSNIQHTLYIFQKMYDMLPPLIPNNISESFILALREAQKTSDIRLEDLEDVMIEHGKRTWPYMRAFDDIFRVYESDLGHKLLSQRVSQGVRKKIDMLIEMGGKYQDISSGSTHDIFEQNERIELMKHLVDLKYDIRKHSTQAILSHDKKNYEKKVEQYAKMVEEINELLEDMRRFAYEEAHEHIVADIHSHVRAIDLQFAYLAPRVGIAEIRILPEYYRGKHEERMFY